MDIWAEGKWKHENGIHTKSELNRIHLMFSNIHEHGQPGTYPCPSEDCQSSSLK